MILSAFGYLESQRIRIMLDVHALGATYYHITIKIMLLFANSISYQRSVTKVIKYWPTCLQIIHH